jgi:hypothetical protein
MTFTIVDSSYSTDKWGIDLTQTAHALIPQPHGQSHKTILQAHVQRMKRDFPGTAGVRVMTKNMDWSDIINLSLGEVDTRIPPVKDRTADHRSAMEAVAAEMFERAIRILTL